MASPRSAKQSPANVFLTSVNARAFMNKRPESGERLNLHRNDKAEETKLSYRFDPRKGNNQLALGDLWLARRTFHQGSVHRLPDSRSICLAQRGVAWHCHPL